MSTTATTQAKVSQGSQAVKIRPGSARGAGKGNGAAWVWSVCLRNTSIKVCPSQSSPFTAGGEGPKGLHLKTRGQRNPKPPRHLKSFIHSKSSEQRGAAPRSPRRCLGAMQDCKQRRGQQPGEGSSSTVTEASAPPSHIRCFLVEH